LLAIITTVGTTSWHSNRLADVAGAACADSAFGSERIAQETDASRSGLRKFLLGQNLENQRSEMRNKEAAVIFIRTLKGLDHIFFIQSPEQIVPYLIPAFLKQ
jgi:hypothetical protein